MASENEGKRETLAAIAAEIRSYGDRPPPKCAWLDIADRIEAIDSADAWRSLYTQGNAAAMREALDLFVEYSELVCKMGMFNRDRLIAITTKARAALAAPARNCDRFADETDAQIAFLNEVWLISVDRETMLALDKYENWSDGMRTRYGRWLLAPAAERKGEGDGRQ